MTRRCLRCGVVGPVHGHHVTLRDGRGRYLHPDLKVSLCPECHRGLHRLLQRAHVESVAVVTPDVVVARISIFRAWMDWPWLGRTTDAVLPAELEADIGRVSEEAAASQWVAAA